MARRLQPTLSDIGEAARALRAGKLVAFPTETVYGLGGDATSDRAVAAIFAAKGRPSFNPLVNCVANISGATQFAAAEPVCRKQLVALLLARPIDPQLLPRQRDCCISLRSAARRSVQRRRSHAPPILAHKIAQTLLMMANTAAGAPNILGRIA
ncbi:MAG: Sua5/YciO/YrdC/YwlC family protein [Dongiaceae bacterium]